MTTYNTGNPVGSTDARDLYDNAQALDAAVNSTANTFTDRLGVSRKTLKWMETAATGVPAVEAALAAEAARDAALIQSGVYPDEPTGRAAVADGQAFKVQGSGDVAAYEYRRVNAGTVSTLIATYPSASAFASLKGQALNYPIQKGATWSMIDHFRNFLVDLDLSAYPSYNPALFYSFAEMTFSATGINFTLYSATSASGANFAGVGFFSATLDMSSKDVVLIRGTGNLTGCTMAVVPGAWPSSNYQYYGSITWTNAGVDPLAFFDNQAGVIAQIIAKEQLDTDLEKLDHIWSPWPDWEYGNPQNWRRKAIPEVTLDGTPTAGESLHFAVIQKTTTIHIEMYGRTGGNWSAPYASWNITSGINDNKLVLLEGTIPSGAKVAFVINPSLVPAGLNESGIASYPLSDKCWIPELGVLIRSVREYRKRFAEYDATTSTLTTSYSPSIAYLHPNDETENAGDTVFQSPGLGQYVVMPKGAAVQKIETAFYNSNGQTFKGTVKVVKFAAGTFVYPNIKPTSGTLVEQFTYAAGTYPERLQLILKTPVFLNAGDVLAVYATSDTGYAINLAHWWHPWAGETNTYNRVPILYAPDGVNYSQGSAGPNYGYWGIPLRLYSNAVSPVDLKNAIQAVKADALAFTKTDILNPRIVLPARVHAVVGKEFNLYYDAFALLPEVGPGQVPMLFDVVCPIGKNDGRSFRVTPTSGQVGDHSLVINVYDNRGTIIATKSITLTVVAAANPASTKRIVCIGDSTTDDTGVVTQTMQSNLAGFSGVTPAFVGTHGAAPYNMEARTGSTYSYYANGGTRYKFYVTGAPTGSVWKLVTTASNGSGYFVLNEEASLDANGNGWIIGNVWVNPTTPVGAGWTGTLNKPGGGTFTVTNTEVLTGYSILKDNGGVGSLNFANYVSRFNLVGCDLLVMDLGINDCRSGSVQSEATTQAIVDQAKAIISSFLAYNAAGKVMVCLPKSCASSRDSTGAIHDAYRANIHQLREKIVSNFDNFAFSSRVYVSASGAAMDRWYGYPLQTGVKVADRYNETITIQTDAVHPRSEGYYQVADAMAASVAYILAQS